MLKKNLLITLTLALGAMLLASCGGGSSITPGEDNLAANTGEPDAVIAARTPSDDLPADEIVYMSDFKYGQANHLYSIYLNEDTGEAELTDLGTFPDNSAELPAQYQNPVGYYTFNAQIGTTADGTRVYCFDYWSGMMVYYDVESGTFVDTGFKIHTGSTVLNVGEVTFGAPYDGNDWGDLYVATTSGNNILRVDPLTGAAENMGTIAYDLGGYISVSAGDLAFDDEGNFYLLTVGSPGKGIYLIEGWEGDGPWSLTGSLLRAIGGTASYRGLAITDGGAGDWLGDNDTGLAIPPNFDYIVKFESGGADVPYPMYLGGSPFNHGAGGDMSVGRLGQEEQCPPYETNLIAGQNINVGTVTIEPGDGELLVTYEITEPGWCMTESHLHVATAWEDIPQKNGNPVPGQFDYASYYDPCVTSDTYVIPAEEGWCAEDYLYIAAHAVVRKQIGVDEYGNPIYQIETAWGEGPNFPGKNWAMYIEWEVCCNE